MLYGIFPAFMLYPNTIKDMCLYSLCTQPLIDNLDSLLGAEASN